MGALVSECLGKGVGFKDCWRVYGLSSCTIGFSSHGFMEISSTSRAPSHSRQERKKYEDAAKAAGETASEDLLKEAQGICDQGWRVHVTFEIFKVAVQKCDGFGRRTLNQKISTMIAKHGVMSSKLVPGYGLATYREGLKGRKPA